jgi:hypothetical protein
MSLPLHQENLVNIIAMLIKKLDVPKHSTLTRAYAEIYSDKELALATTLDNK